MCRIILDKHAVKRSMKINKKLRYMYTKSFIYAQDLRLALYKGLLATAAILVQKVVAGKDPGTRALWVKLTKMIDVPRVIHWNAILGLQADSARSGDSFHPIRAFPLWRQLV